MADRILPAIGRRLPEQNDRTSGRDQAARAGSGSGLQKTSALHRTATHSGPPPQHPAQARFPLVVGEGLAGTLTTSDFHLKSFFLPFSWPTLRMVKVTHKGTAGRCHRGLDFSHTWHRTTPCGPESLCLEPLWKGNSLL